MSSILDGIDNPQDLKKLNKNDLQALCQDIREFLVDKVSKTGGHLAPNLGVVELSVALHYVFNSPTDKIIFDVGHQTYVHKILTGRKNDFDKLRQFNGLSGFPRPYESEHDVFSTGHSSTSISSAIGIATANYLANNPAYTIAIIGDGALTGGLALEAMNNVSVNKLNLIVILNDNQMSIAPSVGSLSTYLSKIRSGSIYTNSKRELRIIITKIPLIGKPIYRFIGKCKKTLRHIFVPKSSLFEQFGFSYIGPIDGNDIDTVVKMFERAKHLNKPVLIHLITKKGKGYLPAEINPNKFHGVGPFNKETGETESSKPSYSSKFGEVLCKKAESNDKIIAITAAMPDGTGLGTFKATYKNRFFDVGIAEEHAVTFASGLAKQGYMPVFACYSTFLQRAYDQIIHDVAMQNLHVIFAIDRAGIVGQDGESHQGLLDESYLSTIPNMTVLAPKDGQEFEAMLDYAFEFNGPIAIRYPRGSYSYKLTKQPLVPIKNGKAEVLVQGKDLTIVAYGKMVNTALEVSNLLKKKNVHAEVINARFLKPLDKDTIKKSVEKTKNIFTIEDAYLNGGLATAVQNTLFRTEINASYFFGYPDKFIKQGKVDQIEKAFGLDKYSIYNQILKCTKLVKNNFKKKKNKTTTEQQKSS